MEFVDTEGYWNIFGEIDPDSRVVSWDEFRREHLDSVALDRFSQSGQDHVYRLLETVRSKVDSEFSAKKAMD